jgi:hypothetical protein
MFGDYFYNISRDTAISSIPNKALDGAKDLNGFQIRKIYFTYDSDISKKISARFRLEAEQVIKLPDGKLGVAVKDAFFRWKNIFPGSDFYFGLQPTPAFYSVVDFWGYRLIEKAPLDLRGIAPSRDIAVSLKGKIDGNGIINYWVLIGNGSNNNSNFDKYKRIYAHLNLIPSKSLEIIFYGDVKFRPDIDVNKNESHYGLSNNIYSTDLFLGYKFYDLWRFGIEGFLQKIENGSSYSGIFKNRNSMGFSIFHVYNFSRLFAAIGRYDYFDPDTDFNGDSRNYFILGISCKPDPNFSITPNFLYETYERIPGFGTYKSSLTARITFFYNYL